MVEAPIFDRRYQTSQRFRLSSEKIGSSNRWKTCGFVDTIFIIFRLFHCYTGHLTSFALRVKTAYNRSFGGRGNKARLSISFPAESEAARLSSLG